MAEREEEKNTNKVDRKKNSKQTLLEEACDDHTEENLVYILNNDEDEFTSIISSDEGVPTYLKQFVRNILAVKEKFMIN